MNTDSDQETMYVVRRARLALMQATEYFEQDSEDYAFLLYMAVQIKERFDSYQKLTRVLLDAENSDS